MELCKVLPLLCDGLTARVLIMILHMQASIFSSSEGIWISLLMRALLWPSWERSSHWSQRREGEAKWNLTQPWKQSNPCGHLQLHDALSESPDTSKLPLLWRWAEPFLLSLPSPLSRSNFYPHFNHCMWNAIVSSLEAVVSSRTKVIAGDW